MGLSPHEWLVQLLGGDLTPGEKPHLRYLSVWHWFQAEGIPCPLSKISDVAEQRWRQQEYSELQRYLFAHHLAGLPEDEQQLFLDRRHPSQSHTPFAASEPIAELLRAELVARDIAAEVSVAHLYDGSTVLDVCLPEWPLGGQWPDDLAYFCGYQVHISC